MKLLSLLISLSTLLYMSCAYDVFFDDKFKMQIDNQDIAIIENFRYNSSKNVYCEVTLLPEKICPFVVNDVQRALCSLSKPTKFRLKIELYIRDFTTKCRNSFKTTSHFKQVNLMSGNQNVKYLSDLTGYVGIGYLPRTIDTYNNMKLYFKFKTKNDCVFYGDIKKIYSYQI